MSSLSSRAAQTLRVLADPMRWRIVTLLSAERLCVCHLQDELAAKQTLVSHHLRVLREAGLLEAEPHGRFTYYRLRPDALSPLRDVLAELASPGRSEPPKRPC